jgi:hypothetical protein
MRRSGGQNFRSALSNQWVRILVLPVKHETTGGGLTVDIDMGDVKLVEYKYLLSTNCKYRNRLNLDGLYFVLD